MAWAMPLSFSGIFIVGSSVRTAMLFGEFYPNPGTGTAAMPDAGYSFLTIYVLGPLAGGTLASLFFTAFIQPLMNKRNQTGCGCLK